ncbi:hypothetical protein DSD27_05380, partial [Limosilactobacillus fermentum]|nr:hypothetical protein [Limosilactobacillus fermentum]
RADTACVPLPPLFPNVVPPLLGRLPTCYSPVRHSLATKINQVQAPSINWANAFDLHVLGTPPAFILSQDQTLI